MSGHPGGRLPCGSGAIEVVRHHTHNDAGDPDDYGFLETVLVIDGTWHGLHPSCAVRLGLRLIATASDTMEGERTIARLRAAGFVPETVCLALGCPGAGDAPPRPQGEAPVDGH